MALPELPKIMKRREAEIQLRVAKKLVKVHAHRNWLLEVKTVNGKQKPHQKTAQKQVENGTFLWKPPDMGKENPGDYIHLGDADYILCSETKVKNQIVCQVNGGVAEYTFRI
jgi:hypothetical protein